MEAAAIMLWRDFSASKVRLAEWKINQVFLYTEHTFAYEGHETVWKDADPLTPA